MDRETAADLYEEDAADLISYVNDLQQGIPTWPNQPAEWYEEMASQQLSNANFIRRGIR